MVCSFFLFKVDLRGAKAKTGVKLVHEAFHFLLKSQKVMDFIPEFAGANAMYDDQLALVMQQGQLIILLKGFQLEIDDGCIAEAFPLIC